MGILKKRAKKGFQESAVGLESCGQRMVFGREL